MMRSSDRMSSGSFDDNTATGADSSAPGGGSVAPAAASSKRISKKKRSRSVDNDPYSEDNIDDIVSDPAKLSTLSRSERKRYREKKRRSDVNKGFDDLMNLLVQVDPDVRAEADERARRGQWKGGAGGGEGAFGAGAGPEDNLLSRVDLIARTVSVLGRLNRENEQRKLLIDKLMLELSVRGAGSQQNSRVRSSTGQCTCCSGLFVSEPGVLRCRSPVYNAFSQFDYRCPSQPSLSLPSATLGSDNATAAARIAAARSQLYQSSALSQLAAASRPGGVTADGFLAGSPSLAGHLLGNNSSLSQQQQQLHPDILLRGLGSPSGASSGLAGLSMSLGQFGGIGADRMSALGLNLRAHQLLQNRAGLFQTAASAGAGLFQQHQGGLGGYEAPSPRGSPS